MLTDARMYRSWPGREPLRQHVTGSSSSGDISTPFFSFFLFCCYLHPLSLLFAHLVMFYFILQHLFNLMHFILFQ
jgi:hypothetical protein